MNKKKPLLLSLRTAAIVIVSVIIYAYGFEVTQMGFDEINSPTRQASLTRVIRALFHPEIFEYSKELTPINIPFLTPCQEQTAEAPDAASGQPYLVITPACAEPRSEITVEGYNFSENTRGQVYFIPPSGVNLGLGQYETDENGHFSIKAKVPPRPNEQVQYIRAIISKNVGKPRLSQNALDTWEKIVETVFLALLATTFGIILAVPVSFIAARNMMKDVTMPMSSLALTVIGWPLGMWLGGSLGSWLGRQSSLITENVPLTIISFLAAAFLIWGILRWSIPREELSPPGRMLRIGRTVGMFLAVTLGIFALFLVASLAIGAGSSLVRKAGFTGMMGSFVENLGVILQMLIALIAALIGGGVVSGMFDRLVKRHIRPLPKQTRFQINLFLGASAGALVFVLVMAAIDWIYRINDPRLVLWGPALLGALLGILTVILNREKDKLAVGMVIYYITRTILNTLRAIEALIWVIIFVVWVGIGPFAGVLALALHTVAALGKLYSEQVESISPGPLEAVKATGANRLQVIVYSVVPQIIPLYISFTMYRWDINVRMSTIIGFAGGGGIGFLLLQNINQLQYRSASTQMIAIAVVVAAMDYLSSFMREKIV